MAQQINLRDVRVLLREYIRKSSRLGILFSQFEKTGVLTSLAEQGVAPISTSSSTRVDNLNAQFLSGHTADEFVLESEISESLVGEAVDDRVAALIQDSPGITWTYNDPAGTLTPVIDSSVLTPEHGNLTSLDADDHPQYLLVDGSRPMSGDLTIGGDLTVSGVVQFIETAGTSGFVLTAIDSAGTASWLAIPEPIDLTGDLTIGGNLTVSGVVQFDPASATSGFILTATDSLGNATWQPVPENLSLDREEFVSTEGQTLFTLTTFTYTLDGQTLHVYNNGQLLRAGPGEDYLETSTSSITFNVAPVVGSNIVLEALQGGALSLTDADSVDTFHASQTYQSNQLIALDANAKFPTGLTVAGSGVIEGTLFAGAISSLSPLELQTGGTTRIFVDDITGFVGIGTGINPPVGQLDIAGSIYLDRLDVSPSGVPGKVALFIDDTTGQLFTTDESGNPVPAASGVGLTIFDEGIELPQREDMDFAGAGVTVTDTGGKILVTIPGGGAITFEQDTKTASGPSDKTIALSFTPITDSETVIHNGVALLKGASNDYTISGDTITLEAAVIVTAGDEILVLYAR